MSNKLTLFGNLFDGVLDNLFDNFSLDVTQKFPPCNVQRSDDGKGILIEVALAGFKKDELTVKREGSSLVVEGRSKREPKQSGFTQIAYRDFTRKWTVAQNTKVDSVTFEDGLLSILLVHDTPLVEQFQIK